MHLLKRFGASIDEIEKDGFKVHDKVYMALDGYNNGNFNVFIYRCYP